MTDSTSLDDMMSCIQSFREADTDDLEELSELLGLDLLKDYAGADLREVELSGKNLEGADFSYTDLQGANLSHANLRSANLEGANLSQANLSHSDLTGADLSSANLTGAILINTLGVEQYPNQEPTEDTDWDIDFEIEFDTSSPELKIATCKFTEQAGTSLESLSAEGVVTRRPVFDAILIIGLEFIEIVKEKVFSQSYFSSVLTNIWDALLDSLKRVSPRISKHGYDSMTVLGRERLLSAKILSLDRESKVIQLQIQHERDENELNQIFDTMEEGESVVVLGAYQSGAEKMTELFLSGLPQEILDRGSFEVPFIGGNRLERNRSKRRGLKSRPLVRILKIRPGQVKDYGKIVKSNEEVNSSQSRE